MVPISHPHLCSYHSKLLYKAFQNHLSQCWLFPKNLSENIIWNGNSVKIVSGICCFPRLKATRPNQAIHSTARSTSTSWSTPTQHSTSQVTGTQHTEGWNVTYNRTTSWQGDKSNSCVWLALAGFRKAIISHSTDPLWPWYKKMVAHERKRRAALDSLGQAAAILQLRLRAWGTLLYGADAETKALEGEIFQQGPQRDSGAELTLKPRFPTSKSRSRNYIKPLL